jgi:hypothetical protein
MEMTRYYLRLLLLCDELCGLEGDKTILGKDHATPDVQHAVLLQTKEGRKLLPLFCTNASVLSGLKLIDQLNSHGRLVLIGIAPAALINSLIGPILAHLGAAEQHFGELVAAG